MLGAPLAVLLALAADETPGWRERDKVEFLGSTFHLALVTGTLAGPMLRASDGHTEMKLDQSLALWGLKLSGVWRASPNWAFEAGVLAFKTADIAPFAYRDPMQLAPGTTSPPTRYRDATLQLWQTDMQVHWLPWRMAPFSLYGVLGLGAKSFAYNASDSAFGTWDGAHADTEFAYSYGLGLRLFPIAHVSAFAEWRLVPGDHVYSCSKLGKPLGGGWYECLEGGESQDNGMLWSLGLSVSLP
jgi:hypothetical protein